MHFSRSWWGSWSYKAWKHFLMMALINSSIMYMMIILVMSYSWKPLDANDSQWIWIVNALRVISSRTFEEWGKKYQAVNPRKGELMFTLLMIWVQEGRTTKGAFCTILLLILWYFLIQKKKNSMIFINFGLINTNLDLKYSRSMLTSPNKRLISSKINDFVCF